MVNEIKARNDFKGMHGILNISKTIDRLDFMLENAINGIECNEIYDEYKISALEVKLNQYLRMKQEEQRQLSNNKRHVEQLISDISHQTKTPIANLMLYSSLIKEQQLSAESMLLAEEISRQSERLNFLVQAMIKSSQLETGVISVCPVKNNVMHVLYGCGAGYAKGRYEANKHYLSY